jgi:osmotically inducible protein OsmC
MPIHKAQAAWHGTFADGVGEMRLGSGAFEGAYSYRSRMEGSAPGTNPEELLAAAHAGCFSMSLARRLSTEGYPPERIHTEARVRFGRAGEGYAIGRIELRTEAGVPGVDEGLFLEKAEAAKRDCAISKALAGVEEITLEAKLVEHEG